MPDIWTSAVALAAVLVVSAYAVRRARSSAHPMGALRGPESNWLVGELNTMFGQPGAGVHIAHWGAAYGGVFRRPGPFGSSDVCVLDPRAAAHILGNSDNVWHIEHFSKLATEHLVGRGLIAADGESHRRQKKSIAPGFTSVKIREYTSTFYDCAHKVASKWAAELETTDTIITDMNKWFSAYSLDTVGIAGLGYDMGALDGRPSAVAQSFHSIAESSLVFRDILGFMLTAVHPVFASLPTPRRRAVEEMGRACTDVSRTIISRARAEEKGERSVMGLLVQAESANSSSMITEEEVTSQVRTLIAAGYETTSSALSWIMLELCKDQALQQRVRAELLAAFPVEDPTHDELAAGLPLLDAVIHEVLRVYPPLSGARRTAQADDVVPLLAPITLADGTTADRVFLPKGTTITIQMEVMNHSTALWGADAAAFRPDRWLAPLPAGAQAIAGYHHLMTFLDGPKACLGRSFAIANIKALLATLVRRFAFELPGGPKTAIGVAQTIVARPTIAGEARFAIPVRVRRFVD